MEKAKIWGGNRLPLAFSNILPRKDSRKRNKVVERCQAKKTKRSCKHDTDDFCAPSPTNKPFTPKDLKMRPRLSPSLPLSLSLILPYFHFLFSFFPFLLFYSLPLFSSPNQFNFISLHVVVYSALSSKFSPLTRSGMSSSSSSSFLSSSFFCMLWQLSASFLRLANESGPS